MKAKDLIIIHMQRILRPGKAQLRLWLVLLLCSAFSLADVAEFATGQPGAPFAIAGLVCLAVFKATVLTALYVLTSGNRILRTLAVSLIVIFVGLSLFNGFSWLFYGFGISRKLAGIVFETNSKEIGEFMPELRDKLSSMILSPGFAATMIAFVILWIMIPLVPRKIFLGIVSALSVLGFGYLCYVFATAEFGRANHLVFARTYRCIKAQRHDSAQIKELMAKRKPLPYGETASSRNKAERVVVVIGESASRDHLSLYGYPLPTTPRLDTISEGLYVFTDAIASSTSTAENLPRMLTFMTDRPGEGEWYEYPTLLQLFKTLGYHTYWLSNQEKTGEWSNLSGILSSDADVVKYLGSENSEDHYLYRYDDVLLPELDEAVSTPDSLQLTFLHLMGSHFQYHNRYPADRARFSSNDILTMDKTPNKAFVTKPSDPENQSGENISEEKWKKEALMKSDRDWLNSEKAQIIANYDNSILFTDSVLKEAIGKLVGLNEPAILVYLSDHGENVYDDRDYRGRDPKFVRVPFIIYANKTYREENPEVIEALTLSKDVSFSTSELPQLLLHLTGTRYAAYDSISDPLSPSFLPRTRYVDSAPYPTNP